MWELLYSVSHSFIQCFVFVFNKLNLFSVFCIRIQKTKITFNGLHKHSLHQTYIQWTRQICIGIKNWLLFVFIVSLCVYFYSIRACTFNKVKKNLLLSIYHDWECVSSGMTISSFCFLGTQRFMKHCCNGEGVSSAVYI